MATVLFFLHISRMCPMDSRWALLALFVTCFSSFTWGMVRYFRVSSPTPRGVRSVQVCGAVATVLHLFALIDAVLHGLTTAGASVLYGAALALFWWSVYAHSHRPPAICYAPERPEYLLTTGPYRWVRHPFYTAYMLAWSAGVLATLNPWLLISIVVMFTLYIRAARAEELAFSGSALAPAFASYQATTGMFLPWRRRCAARDVT